MSEAFVEPIIAHWRELRDYAIRLTADLSDQEMVSQPVAAVTMNHPAWVLSHLGAYGPVLTGILRGEPVEDPINHRYGMRSKPEPDAGEYLPKDELVESFTVGFDAAAESLVELTPERLVAPPPFERWHERFPTLAHLSTHLLLKHNATHLGQVSAWRRAGGRPPV